MTETISINLRTTPEKAQILADLANQQDRSRNYLINQALDSYIHMQQDWIDGVEKARVEIRNGHSIPIDEVFKKYEE